MFLFSPGIFFFTYAPLYTEKRYVMKLSRDWRALVRAVSYENKQKSAGAGMVMENKLRLAYKKNTGIKK